jgi:flagellar biosynthesis regulator FlbT
LSYEFAPPPVSVLEEVTREKAKWQRLTEEDLQPVLNAIRAPGTVKSIREVERMVMRAYVDKLLKASRSSS